MAVKATFKAKYGMKRVKRLATFDGRHVLVGVLRGTGEHPYGKKGQTVAEIAWWNEFGTKRIPARPFMRTTLRENDYFKKELARGITLSLHGLVRGDKNFERHIKVVGVLAAAKVRKRLTDGPWTPNALATIRRKSRTGKQDRPLIDTGTLRKSIQWQLESTTRTGGFVGA